MQLRKTLFILLILVVVININSVEATSSRLFEYCNTGDDGTRAIHDNVWIGQTFTPNESHYITLVKLKLWRQGTCGRFVVGIRLTDENGTPTGQDLTNGTINGMVLTTGVAGLWYDIEIDIYLLSANTTYAIIARVEDSDQSNWCSWRDKDVGTYARGNACRSTNAGSSWTLFTSDQMFEEWECTFEEEENTPWYVPPSEEEPIIDVPEVVEPVVETFSKYGLYLILGSLGLVVVASITTKVTSKKLQGKPKGFPPKSRSRGPKGTTFRSRGPDGRFKSRR